MAPTYSQLADEARSLAAKAHDIRSKADRTPEDVAELRSTISELNDLDALLQVAERSNRDELAALAFANAAANEPTGPTRTGAAEARSMGDQVVDTDAYRDWQRGERFPVTEVRTILTSGTSSNDAGVFLPQGQPIAPKPRQLRFFVRDVLSVQETGLAAIPYIREYTPATTETGATGVAEGSAKPEVEMLFEEDTATVRKIAAWVPATEEILSDAPTLVGYINTRLAYMLTVREQASIINGAGTGAELKGILQFSGVQTDSGNTPDDLFKSVGTGIGKVEAVDGDANFVAVHPTTFWTAQVTRQSTFFDGGSGNAGQPFDSINGSIWGLTAIRTRAITAGYALVGDGVMGATVFDRAAVTIRQSDSHDDYFVKNKVAILAEERIALAVHRPDFFCYCTL